MNATYPFRHHTFTPADYALADQMRADGMPDDELAHYMRGWAFDREHEQRADDAASLRQEDRDWN